MPEAPTRWIYLTLGWVFLALGVLGIFLPVLPTTPFILLAAWGFSRGSERLHRALLEHRRFGPLIRDWEEHRVIRLRAKILATTMIVMVVGFMLFATAAPTWSKILTGILVGWGMIFVWTRDSKPPPPASRG